MPSLGKMATQPSVATMKKRGGVGRGGLIALVAALLVTTGAAGYGLLQMQSAQGAADAAKAQLAAAVSRADEAEQTAATVTEKLTLSKSKLAFSEEGLLAAQEDAKAKELAAAEMQKKLQGALEKGQGQVTRGSDGRLTLELVDKVLFKSGEAELTKRGKKVMAKVGTALKEMRDKQIWVQGHTDKVPVKKKSPFASNWELSAARALTVVHYLQDNSKLNPRRLAAAAFSSYRPVSRRKKAKNRRIEIVLFPANVDLK